MDQNKLSSMAKAMKWIPGLLGAVSLLLAAVALFVKMEDESAKQGILSFASLGLTGIAMIVFGVGNSTLLEAVKDLRADKSETIDDIDIMA